MAYIPHCVRPPRLSVNSVSSVRQTLADDIKMWNEIGIDHVALILPKIDQAGWEEARKSVTEAGLRVSTIFGPTYRPLDTDRGLGTFDEDQRRTVEVVDFAASVGAATVYVCSGAASSLPFDLAVGAFSELVAPAVRRSKEVGVPLLIEPTNPLRVDISFVFWQRDAMDVASRRGPRSCSTFSRVGTSLASRTWCGATSI